MSKLTKFSELKRIPCESSWFVPYKVAEGVTAIAEPHHFEEVISYLIEGEEIRLSVEDVVEKMSTEGTAAETVRLNKLSDEAIASALANLNAAKLGKVSAVCDYNLAVQQYIFDMGVGTTRVDL